MGIAELFLLALGLAMDAFAVSICKGLATKKLEIKHMCIAGLWFGGFQALMPIIGYYLGSTFAGYITKIDHWIAFVLLVFIGLNMIKEAVEKPKCTTGECQNGQCSIDDNSNSYNNESIKKGNPFGVKTMFIMAVATSIDALAVGVTFAFLNVNLWVAVTFIGVVTFIMSAVGIKIGNVFGDKYKSKAELAGGIILILLGVKILVEVLFF